MADPARGEPYRLPVMWRSRAVLLVALLALTLVLAAVLAYEAYVAARSHRATAERALRDYATFAAWQLLANAADELQSPLSAALAPAIATRATSPYDLLPSPSVLEPAGRGVLRCPGGTDPAGRYYFRLDFRDGSFTTSGESPSAGERARVRQAITEHARAAFRPDWRFAILLDAQGPATRALVYGVKYAEHDAPLAAYGFSTCATALAPLFGTVMRRHALLPATVAGGLPNDSLVAMTVLGPAHDTLYATTAGPSTPFTGDASVEMLGGLTARADLRPRAVEQLALGALPDSKLPLLLGLLGLTAAMMVLALLQLRREHELTRLRSDFVSSVSHELRTPLAQILLFAETLSLGRVRTEAERASAAEIIVQEARQLMQLVENVLHVSRAERRLTRLTPETIPLAPWLREIVHSWRPLSGTEPRIALALDEGVVARGDRNALRQMLHNILDNAAKYGPAGQTITVRLVATNGHARISVTDEGPGIPVAERSRIWNAFYRLPRHVSSAIAGSGIGLFVVRELALLQDGRVWVEDGPTGGACVVIELPVPPPVASASTDDRENTPLPPPQRVAL